MNFWMHKNMRFLNEYASLLGGLGVLFLFGSWLVLKIWLLAYVWSKLLVIVGGLLLLLSMIGLYPQCMAICKQKGSIKKIRASIMVGLCFGIFVLTYALLIEYPMKWDWTQNKMYSLSDKSKKIVSKIEVPIQIIVWASKNEMDEVGAYGSFGQTLHSVHTLLGFYQQENPRKIHLRYVDPNVYPHLFQGYGLPSGTTAGALTLRRFILPERIGLNDWNNIILTKIQSSSDKAVLSEAYRLENATGEFILNPERTDDIDWKWKLDAIFENIGYHLGQFYTLLPKDLYAGGANSLEMQGEMKITNKLSALIQQSVTGSVCMVSGHGEKDVGHEYSLLNSVLKLEGYNVQTVRLEQDEIKGCNMVFVAGPKKKFFQHDFTLLKSYLHDGGNIIVMWDPYFEYANVRDKQDPVDMDVFLKMFGLRSLSGFVYDERNKRIAPFMEQHKFLQVMRTKVIHFGQYLNHPIVFGLKENGNPTYFSGIRAFEKIADFKTTLEMDGKEKYVGVWTPFLSSGVGAWLENDLSGDFQKHSGYQKKKNRFNFGWALTWDKSSAESQNEKDAKKVMSKEPGKMLVFGDSNFIDNIFLQRDNGRDIVLNSISWILGKEDGISIRPKIRKRRLVTMNSGALNFVNKFILYVLPSSILLFGYWIRRRRKKMSDFNSF